MVHSMEHSMEHSTEHLMEHSMEHSIGLFDGAFDGTFDGTFEGTWRRVHCSSLGTAGAVGVSAAGGGRPLTNMSVSMRSFERR